MKSMAARDFKICILAAGRGTRNAFSANIPKGLLPIHNKPVISHLIENCNPSVEIVVAVGHQAQILKEFFSVTYPERKITFIDVDKYEGIGSGPGYSLLCCRNALQTPFILLPTDAYIEEKLEPTDYANPQTTNWIGVSPVEDGRSFCLVEHSKGVVTGFCDKLTNPPPTLLKTAYNGIAFIKDFKEFFNALGTAARATESEKQVADGFKGLLPLGLHLKKIPSWHDTGTTESYRKIFSKCKDQQLVKTEELTYLYKNRVIKFHHDPQFIQKKVSRARQLKGLVPEIDLSLEHFLRYKYIPGHLLSEEQSPEKFQQILDQANDSFFKRLQLQEHERQTFKNNCNDFYCKKTLKRVNDFLSKFQFNDNEHIINNYTCPPVGELLDEVDWNKLVDESIPTNFHGDLQPENILISAQPDCAGKAVFLDWRHECINDSNIGDLYYDFAKLKHALIICGQVIRENRYSFHENAKRDITLTFDRKPNLTLFLAILDNFIKANGYSNERCDLITALIYLNIAPFYDEYYAKFLFYFGKLCLSRCLNGHQII